MLMRRQGFSGLGAEAAPKPVDTAKAAAAGAAAGSTLGPIGTVVGAVLKGGASILSSVGLGKKARAGRLAAQAQLEKWLAAARTVADETEQFRNMKLPEATRNAFLRMAIDINNNTHASARKYAAEAGF